MIRCKQCKVWDSPFTTSDGDLLGRCRRHAPHPSLWGTFVDEGGRLMETEAVWPTTNEDDGCAEGIQLT